MSKQTLIKKNEITSNAQLVKSIFRKRGFKAELTTSGNVKVSVKHHGFTIRNIATDEVSQVIYDEELPIGGNQLMKTSSTIDHTLYGIIKVDAVVVCL
jgi:hypothetical protein